MKCFDLILKWICVIVYWFFLENGDFCGVVERMKVVMLKEIRWVGIWELVDWSDDVYVVIDVRGLLKVYCGEKGMFDK